MTREERRAREAHIDSMTRNRDRWLADGWPGAAATVQRRIDEAQARLDADLAKDKGRVTP